MVARLRARRGELVQAIFVGVRDGRRSVAVGARDAEYVAGLRAAVGAACGVCAGGDRARGEDRGCPPPIPAAALEQARRAARVGVSLDTVLRRYVLGSALLGEFVMEEVDRSERIGCRRRAPRAAGVLRAQASVLDRLLAAITGAYVDELARAGRSPERRRWSGCGSCCDGSAVEALGARL